MDIQNVSFIAVPITTALSHRRPASDATYLVSCSAQDSDKTKTIYLIFFACTFRPNKTARNSFEILCTSGWNTHLHFSYFYFNMKPYPNCRRRTKMLLQFGSRDTVVMFCVP